VLDAFVYLVMGELPEGLERVALKRPDSKGVFEIE
jgi:hypothetical protein